MRKSYSSSNLILYDIVLTFFALYVYYPCYFQSMAMHCR